jgi:uncharacterized protein with GYD domain
VIGVGKYAIMGGYTQPAMAAMVQSPSDRSAAAREVIESVGGKLEAFYWMLGEDDFLAIFDAPDDVTAAAGAVAVSSSGAVRNVRTIKLITMDGAQRLLHKAKAAVYHPPTSVPAGRR